MACMPRSGPHRKSDSGRELYDEALGRRHAPNRQLKACLSLDLKGGTSFESALSNLDRLAEGAKLLLGHNLIAFDLPHLRATEAYSRLLSLPAESGSRMAGLPRCETGGVREGAWVGIWQPCKQVSLLARLKARIGNVFRCCRRVLRRRWVWCPRCERRPRYGFLSIILSVIVINPARQSNRGES